MLYTIVVLDSNENFLSFIDPNRCEVKETHKTQGIRTISLEYNFKDLKEENELFRLGNKIWIADDVNIDDCLYVVNTSVKQDIFKDNTFTVELEEVLVELNNTPPFFQTELTSGNGFKTKTTNGQFMVKIDYNALNYWFGNYFNIGVVQDCLSDVASWITISGSITLMSLLRSIEEQTGNIFVTRYEKDVLNNTIHRYLDFLNPINASKNWTLNIEYDFMSTTALVPCYDSNGNPTFPDMPWEVKRYIDNVTPESVPEKVYPADTNWYQKGTEDSNWVWNKKDETVTDENTRTDYTPLANIDPTNINLRITDGENLLNNQGGIYDDTDETQTPLQWTSTDIGFTTSVTHAVITLCLSKNVLGATVNNKTLQTITGVGIDPKGYIPYSISGSVKTYTDSIANQISNDNRISNTVFPDDSYLELYDTVNNQVIFRTCINRQIGHVHEEVLDLTYNISDVEMKIDESSTYTAIAPIIDQSGQNALTRDQTSELIANWRELSVSKGSVIPMIVEKAYITGNTWTHAIENLDLPYADPTDYWAIIFNPNHQYDNSTPANSKWEIWRGSAYWNAPFDKKSGELFVRTNETNGMNYTEVIGRHDNRDEKGAYRTPKIGTTTTTDEDRYTIYNQVALYLKDHMTPNVELTVNVANLHDGIYNNYEVHDKVYIKIPDYEELIVATVNETTKQPNNPSQNTVKLSNYSTNTIKTLKKATLINADNVSFTYPDTGLLTMKLENKEYDDNDSYSIQYPSNKLVSFTVYKVENNTATWTGETYTRTTDENGESDIVMDYDPGDYEIKISYGGDEEYEESSLTVKVNVGGKKEEEVTTDESTGTTTTTTYYDKYGRSPDKSKILAIGRISASRDTGSYANFYETEFKNKCPHCGKQTLYWGIYWAGNEHSNWGKFPATGRSEGGSAEGHIFCSNCDADYSCQGHEHISGGKKLTVTKKTEKSTKAKAYELKNGKRVYAKTTVTNETKNVTNNTERKVISSVDASVKKQALAIVGNKTGQTAAQAIAKWMDNHIRYEGYNDFKRPAKKVLSMKRGNCCDQTRLFLEMCDAAGCTEFFKMEYIYVYGHVYGRLTTKSTGKYVNVDCASDSHAAWGYICLNYRTSVLRKTTYPTRPF